MFLFSIVGSHIYSTLVKFAYSEIIFVKSIFFALKYGLAPRDSILVSFRQMSFSFSAALVQTLIISQ